MTALLVLLLMAGQAYCEMNLPQYTQNIIDTGIINHGIEHVLPEAVTSDEYSEEDLKYVGKVLKFISAKTIWRTFESCNNYDMPKTIQTDCPHIEYWYAKTEEKERKWDIEYIRKHFSKTVFRVFEDIGHGGLAALKPDLLASELERTIEE